MAISSRATIMQNLAAGKGVVIPAISVAGVALTTAQNAADGFHISQFQSNSIGSTLPGTIVGFQLPPAPSTTFPLLWASSGSSVGNNGGVWIGCIYKFGTQVLTSTGDQFTHDAATFPVTRTVLGAATTAVPLIPFIRVTTATTTTAPVLTLKTAAGGAGYKNQAASSIVGTRTLTFGAAATAARTQYLFPLESNDNAVTDITAVQTNTAAVAGAADLWGLEPICPLPQHNSILGSMQDTIFSGVHAADLAPAVATSGTATSYLVLFRYSSGNDVYASWICAVANA